jgi:probable rRNA maturation factor
LAITAILAIMAISLVFIDPPPQETSRAELARFARRAQRLAGVSGQVDILIAGNRRLRELNRCFRKKDKPTDVLSFARDHASGGGGDIAISAEIAAKNAVRYGHPAAAELKVLILHGMLHLAGYDHERDNGEMAARETALRRRLKLPSTLIERTKQGAGDRGQVTAKKQSKSSQVLPLIDGETRNGKKVTGHKLEGNTKIRTSTQRPQREE